MPYDVGNPGPGLGQAHICCRIKPVNEIPTLLPCDNWISHDNININKQEKQPTKIWFHSKRQHTITKMNDDINVMDSTISGSMNARF